MEKQAPSFDWIMAKEDWLDKVRLGLSRFLAERHTRSLRPATFLREDLDAPNPELRSLQSRIERLQDDLKANLLREDAEEDVVQEIRHLEDERYLLLQKLSHSDPQKINTLLSKVVTR